MELRNSQWISSNDKLDQIFHWFSGKIQAYARHNPLRNACDPNHVTPYSFSLTAFYCILPLFQISYEGPQCK